MIKLKSLLKEIHDVVDTFQRLEKLGFVHKGGQDQPHTNYIFSSPADKQGLYKQITWTPNKAMHFFIFRIDKKEQFKVIRKATIGEDDIEQFLSALEQKRLKK